MPVNRMLLTVGIACAVLGIILNTRHVSKLDESYRVKFLRDGNPAKWAALVHIVLAVLIVRAEAWMLAGILILVLLLECAYFARMQHRYLKLLEFPESWLHKKNMIDLVFLIAIILVFGSVLYSKLMHISG